MLGNAQSSFIDCNEDRCKSGPLPTLHLSPARDTLIAANSNDTVKYTCELSRGDPDVSVVWELADDQDLENNSNFFIVDNALSSSLVVTIPEKVDNKKLQCILKSTSNSTFGSCPPCEGPVSIIVYGKWLSHRRNTCSLYVRGIYISIQL